MIADACRALRRLLRYVEGHTLSSFAESDLTIDAVERQLTILGEALARTDEAFRLRHPEIPWRDLIGLRHRLSHEYGQHLTERVWRQVREMLPPLQPVMEGILPPTLRHTLDKRPGFRPGAE